MTSSSLVAQRVDTTSPLAGSGLISDGADLCAAVEQGSWLQGGMAGVAFAVDTAAMVSDPLGSLIAAGLGWLMDHLSPLNDWLEDLTGDADEVRAFSQTWANVATRLDECGRALSSKVQSDLAELAGAAADAYRALTGDTIDHLGAATGWAGAISTGLQVAATIVQVVHDLVRDTLAQLVGSIISWVAELALTVGLATPVVVEQVATRVASLARRLASSITDLVGSLRSLGHLLESLRALFRRGSGLFDEVLTGVRRTDGAAAGATRAADDGARGADDAAGAATTAAHAAGGGRPLPDISDIPHPRDGGDLATWATEVARRHGDLTADEVTAIYRYTTNPGYKEMNAYLRGTQAFGPEDAARIQRDVDDATSGLSKLPTVPGKTFRGTDLPEAVVSQLKVGERFPEEAFLSTSTKESIAQEFRGPTGNAMLVIEGRSGVDVQALSHYGREREVLLPPHSDLVVTEMVPSPDGTYMMIYLEER